MGGWCYCSKCKYELLEDCEVYHTINEKVIFLGFYCRNCGEFWLDDKKYLLPEEEIEKIKEKYRNSVVL